jgi:tetratricopeptide (TPR) repeat protein
LVARLSNASPPLDQSTIKREKVAFEEACRKVEADHTPTNIYSLGREVLLHLFGEDGFTSLRAGNWRFISIVAPVFGFFADVCTVFAHSAPTLLLVFAVLGMALAVPIWLRTRYCQHCAVPCVFAFIMVMAFGFVAVTQKVFAAEDEGVAAKFIPGIPEVQTRLAEILGIQKKTLVVVERIDRTVADNSKRLDDLNKKIDANNAIVQKLSDRLTAGAAPAEPLAKAGLAEAVAALAACASTDPRCAKAYEFLKEGKPAEAEPSMLAVAKVKAKSDSKDAAAAYRNLAAIAAVSDPGRAREYYAEAARLDPANVEGMLLNGWFQQDAGHLVEAQAAYDRVVAMAMRGRDDEFLIWAQMGTGDIFQARGNLPEALKTYRDGLAIRDRLAKSDPGNAGWQRDLSVSYNKIGDVLVAQGNLPEALKSYRDGLAIADRLAKSDPGHAGWQRDLSVSYEKIGDVLVAQGNLPEALKTYRNGLAIADRLAKSDPGNAGWQRDLSVSYDRVGDVLVAQGNLPEALKTYRNGLAIADRLAKSDPGNAGWQRDLSVSYNKIGDVLVAQGNLPEALKTYRDGLAIRDRLAKSDPGNAGWQRDLSASYARLAGVFGKAGDKLKALEALRQGRAIMVRMTSLSPDNAVWKRDLDWFDEQIVQAGR